MAAVASPTHTPASSPPHTPRGGGGSGAAGTPDRRGNLGGRDAQVLHSDSSLDGSDCGECCYSNPVTIMGSIGTIGGIALTSIMLTTLLMALIYNATGLTTGFSPSGLATAWEVTQWAAVAAGGGIVLLIADCARRSLNS